MENKFDAQGIYDAIARTIGELDQMSDNIMILKLDLEDQLRRLKWGMGKIKEYTPQDMWDNLS